MAVTKLYHLDENGVQTMSEYLLRATNSRIKERISTAVNSAAYSDDNHVLSAKAVLGNIGNLGNYGSMDGTEASVLGKVKNLDLRVGASTDARTDNTVYGYIKQQVYTLEQTISGLTHLTYQVVTGPISGVTDPAEDVIYLQHDTPSFAIGTDGYFLNAQGTHAQYDDGENPVYEAWMNASTGYIYKMIAGVQSVQITTDDPIFQNVALVDDNTYNLYVWVRTSAEGVTPVTHEWVCVGDTSLELSNYWSKSDEDVTALQNRIIGSLTDQQIIAKVQAAWNATDPYADPDTNSYVPASWISE